MILLRYPAFCSSSDTRISESAMPPTIVCGVYAAKTTRALVSVMVTQQMLMGWLGGGGSHVSDDDNGGEKKRECE